MASCAAVANRRCHCVTRNSIVNAIQVRSRRKSLPLLFLFDCLRLTPVGGELVIRFHIAVPGPHAHGPGCSIDMYAATVLIVTGRMFSGEDNFPAGLDLELD